MPLIKVLGDSIAQTELGNRQTAANPTTKAAQSPIDVDRWCRNGTHPNATLLSLMNEHGNAAALYRTKAPYQSFNRLSSALSSTASSRTRARVAWHSGPYTHALLVVVVMLPPDSNPSANTYSTFKVYSDATETTTIASEEFYYGVSPTGTDGAYGWNYLKVFTRMVDGISPDTDYFAKFADENYGRIQSCTVFELASLSENFNGYLSQSITAFTPIEDVYREKLAEMTRALWSKGAAQVFNWNVDDHGSPIVNTTGTATNVVDTSVTTISAASPGYILDMTGKDRISQTSGVPVVLKAFGSVASGTGGNVYLKDSTGATVGSITNGWSSPTPGWVSTTLNIPTTSTSAKYDLQFAKTGGGGNFSLYAVSVYEKD